MSAAVVGAISYATWAGSWIALPQAMSAYDTARWRQTADRFFTEHNTTRSQYMADQDRKCMERWKEQSNKEVLHGSGLSSPLGTLPEDFGPCHQEPIGLEQESSIASYYAGLSASLAVLSQWFFDIFMGALAGISLVTIGPFVVGRYIRWLWSS
jgi:hypothetical protein